MNCLMGNSDYRLAALRRNKTNCRNESATKESIDSPPLPVVCNSVVCAFYYSRESLSCDISIHMLFVSNMICEIEALYYIFSQKTKH